MSAKTRCPHCGVDLYDHSDAMADAGEFCELAEGEHEGIDAVCPACGGDVVLRVEVAISVDYYVREVRK